MDVLCIGHACCDINVPLQSFPVENSKVQVDQFLEEGGGPAANAAFLLSTWGVSCGFAGLIGKDAYGARVEKEFCSAGVDTAFLETREGLETPLSVILTNQGNGSRTIINRRKSSDSMQPIQIPEAFRSPKILLFDGHEAEASISAMRLFPEAITVLDAGSQRRGTEVLARKVDYLAASERFALSFTGLPHLNSEVNRARCIDILWNENGKQVVVTLGERGLIYSNDGATKFMPAFSVQAVDTTGAGDIFHGALVYGLLQGFSLEETLRLASMAAAISVETPGGRRSVPALQKVHVRLAAAGLSENIKK